MEEPHKIQKPDTPHNFYLITIGIAVICAAIGIFGVVSLKGQGHHVLSGFAIFASTFVYSIAVRRIFSAYYKQLDAYNNFVIKTSGSHVPQSADDKNVNQNIARYQAKLQEKKKSAKWYQFWKGAS
jgi:hypothetical protein